MARGQFYIVEEFVDVFIRCAISGFDGRDEEM